jgi:glutamyl-tRNA reductase
MILLAIGCSYRTTPVDVRERLAFTPEQQARALEQLCTQMSCEAVILSTCNRVELYLGRVTEGTTPAAQSRLDSEQITDLLAGFHGLPAEVVRAHLYVHQQADAVRHLFRVAASLDSMLIGEGQIAGQVKKAYETAQQHDSVGALLHALFRQARQVARRVRTETGISRGHVSVSSAAVDYVRQVFDHFGDKTVLVLGAGKMGELTLRHLRRLRPRRIWVSNRSPGKAEAVAKGCGGQALPWEQLDDLLGHADIVLSTTGAPEVIVSRQRYERIRARRGGRPVVILDIAVPRDFDPAIHDGDTTCLFNIDDLQRIREATLAERLEHVPAAEAIVADEARRFLADWARRRNGPIIARLTKDFEEKRKAVLEDLLGRLNGRLSEEDRRQIEGAFRLLQNRFLHGPISALAEETRAESSGHGGHTLLDALRKLFGLPD